MSTPTNPTPSVTGVAVAGNASTIGVSAQFTATATLSDGTSQNVTAKATWSSSNPAVATVTSGGVVTAVAVGEADVTATYVGVSGKARVSPARPAPVTVVIGGTVTDGFSGGILPNITVQVVDGSGATKSTRTDASGNYSVSSVTAGSLTVSFSAVSYVAATKMVTVTTDMRIDMVLQRAGPTSGPALLTLHADFVYVVSLGCIPDTRGRDFSVPGARSVDDQRLTFVVPGPFNPPLTLSLTRVGNRLTGQIGGGTNALLPIPYDDYLEIADVPFNHGHPATANGGIGADGRVSGVMIGTIFVEHINPQFICSGTFPWTLTDR